MLGMIKVGLVEGAALGLVDRPGVAVAEVLKFLAVEFHARCVVPVEAHGDCVALDALNGARRAVGESICSCRCR